MRCVLSVIFSNVIPSETTEAAEDGTASHELGEHCLRHNVDARSQLGKIFNGYVVDDDRAFYVQQYIDLCREISGDWIGIEQRVSIDRWVPGNSGTSDFATLVREARRLRMVDLKYGHTPVDAVWNEQQLLYAGGVLDELNTWDDVDIVEIYISQPRISTTPSYFEIETNELAHWLDHEVKPKVQEIYAALKTFKKEFGQKYDLQQISLADTAGIANPGEKQCQWCPGAGQCMAQAAWLFEIVTGDPDMMNMTEEFELLDPVRLKPEQLGFILKHSKAITKFLEKAGGHAKGVAENGERIPGRKLVDRLGDRAWKDEKELVEELLFTTDLTSDDFIDRKVKSPAQLEKLIGKDHTILRDHVTRPHNGLALVDLSDKREAVTVDLASEYLIDDDDFSDL